MEPVAAEAAGVVKCLGREDTPLETVGMRCPTVSDLPQCFRWMPRQTGEHPSDVIERHEELIPELIENIRRLQDKNLSFAKCLKIATEVMGDHGLLTDYIERLARKNREE